MQNTSVEFSDQLKARIIHSILSEGKPQKVYIFGSYARNDWTKDSDLDIFIIENSEFKKGRRASKYFRILKDLEIPKDIIVYTPDEFESLKREVNSLPYTILKEGILIYG
jgi:uncharacterized protein